MEVFGGITSSARRIAIDEKSYVQMCYTVVVELQKNYTVEV